MCRTSLLLCSLLLVYNILCSIWSRARASTHVPPSRPQAKPQFYTVDSTGSAHYHMQFMHTLARILLILLLVINSHHTSLCKIIVHSEHRFHNIMWLVYICVVTLHDTTTCLYMHVIASVWLLEGGIQHTELFCTCAELKMWSCSM